MGLLALLFIFFWLKDIFLFSDSAFIASFLSFSPLVFLSASLSSFFPFTLLLFAF